MLTLIKKIVGYLRNLFKKEQVNYEKIEYRQRRQSEINFSKFH
jgi:anaerobic ribonucleoside-triphosphate reductase